MDLLEFRSIFTRALAQNNLQSLTDTQIEHFYHFSNYLLEINAYTNLTAIRDIPSIIYKHYVDSLMVSHLLPQGARVLDIGCGPGFPSIPLAITRPDLKIIALDSTSKKIDFVSGAIQLLKLQNISGYAGRAEEIATRSKLQKFDFVVSRAVARLNILCELSLPYLKNGGTLIALKGAKHAEEVAEASSALKKLGGELAGVDDTHLVIGEAKETRAAIEIRLKKPVPPQYPRQYNAILKKPL
jgi:16S rRNA (guanine527-N7)-methyltransferase